MSSSEASVTKKNIRAESALAACLRGGRLPHAILVEGLDGTLAFAKKIAEAVVCEAETDRPCGVCKQCVKAEKGIHPDILIYSGAGRARSFHVDSVRELRREAYVRPNDAAAKALILENAQDMTVQAQNALLKIIEEPPGAATFILTCDNKAVLLETILSRVSVFSLDDTPTQGHHVDNSEFAEKASLIVENLLSGRELDSLSLFAPYEKDRAGLGLLIAAIRSRAAEELSEMARAQKKDRNKSKKLMRLVKTADELEGGLSQNVGGLLMSVIFPAKFWNNR